MTRAERLAQITALRRDGLTNRQIAAQLGVTMSAIRNIINDPDGSKQKARRARYQGTCIDCGGVTDGSNGRALAPERCSPCRHIYEQSEEHRLSIQQWPADLLLDRIREWANIYGEPPATPDWCPWHARYLGDEARAKRWEDADGYWPWFTIVVRRFGSWSAGIAAAGFTPRPSHGGGGNQARRRRTGNRHTGRLAA